MWKYWLFQLLFQAVVNVALPLPIVNSNTTSSYDLSPLPVLTPPANLSECVQSNYCNNGTCVLIRDPGPRVSCTCDKPFVDSEAGLCTIKGKSRRTAFITRCLLIFHLQQMYMHTECCSLLVGAFGADWFYLGHGSSIYIAIGTVCFQIFCKFPRNLTLWIR